MKKGKAILKDTILSGIGLLFMNAVLSLIVYPRIGQTMGAEYQGRVLFFTSFAGLLASAFGGGANYGRLKIFSRDKETRNGDFNLFLLVSFAFVALLTVLAVLLKKDSAEEPWIMLILLGISMVLRYYADVEFRLTLRYGHFCLYYVAIAVGYLAGLLLFPVTHSWVLVFLPGEVFGLIYCLIFGKILRPSYVERSPRILQNMGLMMGLAGAYFLSDFVGLSDRLLFPVLLQDGDTLTSYYYYASIVGKMMSLLSSPLNGALMGHLSNENGEISRKNFLKIIAVMAGVFVIVTAGSVLGSHIFVLWRYPQYYEKVKDLFILANAGQVLFFICNTLMVIVLRYTKPRNQIITSAVYIAAFFLVTVPLILKFGLYGMAYGILAVNALKFAVFAVLGAAGLSKGRAEENEQNENSQIE